MVVFGFPILGMALLECRILYGIWIPSIPNTNPIRYPGAIRLLVIVLSLVVDDVEELELVDTLAGGDDAEPVTELHLLQELLGPRVATVISRTVQDAKLGGLAAAYRYFR